MKCIQSVSVLESLSEMLHGHLRNGFYKSIVTQGNCCSISAYLLYCPATYSCIWTPEPFSPPGTELCHRSHWGPFQTYNLLLLPSAPICPNHCNHSTELKPVSLLRALKSANSDRAHLLTLISTSCCILDLLAHLSPLWRRFFSENTLKLGKQCDWHPYYVSFHLLITHSVVPTHGYKLVWQANREA